MVRIAIYGFSGRYSGPSEYEWEHPQLGASHKCMLFLRQHSEANEHESALAECRKYGFSDVENMRFGMLQIDALNTDLYRGFSGFYEEALHSGSALVYYPNKESSDGDAA
jgi:hypothetical protein